MPMPKVEECRHVHCRYHFPRFRPFEEKELHDQIDSILKMANDPTDPWHSHVRGDWPDLDELCVEYRRIRQLPFTDACNALHDLCLSRKSCVRYNLYLDNCGEVCVLVPCCGP